MTRIIAGLYRNHNLFTLDGDNTRPTKEVVRGAIFNSLFSKIEGARVLDLFSGSGAIGIEAKSRGADLVVFNDSNLSAYNIINKNINKLKLNGYELFSLDYQECLERIKEYCFDIIFLDPPYKFDNLEYIFNFIDEYKMLSDKGLIVLETIKDNRVEFDDFELIKNKKYGISEVRYYRNKRLG